MSQLVRLEGKHSTQNAHCALQWLHCTRIAAHWGKRLSNSPRLASLSVWSILDSRALAKRIFIEIQRMPSTWSGKSRAILCQETPIDWHWNWLSSAVMLTRSKWIFSTKSLIRAQTFTLCSAQSAEQAETYVSKNSCLDLSFNIYLSQLVRLEGKHDFWGNRDFQTVNMRFLRYFDRFWVVKK